MSLFYPYQLEVKMLPYVWVLLKRAYTLEPLSSSFLHLHTLTYPEGGKEEPPPTTTCSTRSSMGAAKLPNNYRAEIPLIESFAIRARRVTKRFISRAHIALFTSSDLPRLIAATKSGSVAALPAPLAAI